MHPVYALEELPDPCRASLFLAGPTPRDPVTPSWRPEALRLLAELGYAGAVIIPEARDGEWRHSYVEQTDWEVAMRARADLVAFWVPRELAAMPAFTTNVEFGEDYDSCRCLYGRLAEAPKCRYLDVRWQAITGSAPHDSLRGVLAEAVALLGEGAERHGAERDVPLAIWRTRPFAEWYQALTAAGHTLRRFQARHVLPHGRRHPSSPLFGFIAWAAVDVAGEERIKANEIFLARPDTVAVLPLFDPGGVEAEAFFVREYRLAVRNLSGFVMEAPGGSSPDTNLPPRAVAVEELVEELGLAVDPARLVDLGSRQSAPTLCSCHARLFALALTAEEAARLRQFAAEGRVFGEGEERICVVPQPLAGPLDSSLDWTSIGMLTTAVAALGGGVENLGRTGGRRNHGAAAPDSPGAGIY
jgi:8-oxo-dGTP pyrophosphatase MutT (NUDIX family)